MENDTTKQSAPEQSEQTAHGTIEKADPVSIKTVEVGVPEEGTAKVLTTLTIGHKLHIEKCFKAMKAEVESGVNRSVESLRARVQSVIQSVDLMNQKRLGSLVQDVVKTDKKFSGLYRTLIHEFLVKIEQRILNAELYTTSLVGAAAEDASKSSIRLAAIEDRLAILELKIDAILSLGKDGSLSSDVARIAEIKVAATEAMTEEAWKTKFNSRVDQTVKEFSERSKNAQTAPQEAVNVAIQKKAETESGAGSAEEPKPAGDNPQ